MRRNRIKIPAALCAAPLLLLSACTTPPPADPHNACAIFEERRSWHRSVRRSAQRWDVQPPVVLAFMFQESSFRARAKPPRGRWFFGLLPRLRRPSNAYGYAQALDETWDMYRKNANRRWADRNDFRDAADFIGWYNHQSAQRLGIPPSDAYNLYLAYHEGWGGYQRKTWRNKAWLPPVARKVEARARKYEQQLEGCEQRLLSRRRWWTLWLF